MKNSLLKEVYIVVSPFLWSVRNDVANLNKSFYKKLIMVLFLGPLSVFLALKLLNLGMEKLKSLPSDIFTILLIKGYSLIFLLLFFMLMLSGFIIALNVFFRSQDMNVLMVSPIRQSSLFVAKLIETNIKSSWMIILFGISILISAGLSYQASIFFYAYSLLLLILFSIIPVNIGICATFLTTLLFKPGKIKAFLLSSGITLFAILVLLFRIFKPEKFVNPEFFANLTLFVSELKTPSSILFPSRWIGEAIFTFLVGRLSTTLFFATVLLLTTYLSSILAMIMFNRFFVAGWLRMQEGSSTNFKPRTHGSFISSLLSGMFFSSTRESRAIVKKDILYQFRDIKNINQVILLFSLIAIYLFSISALPLNWESTYILQLKYIVAFMNLGLVLFIVSALCSRIVYNAILSEIPYIWIYKTSPLTPTRFIITKFFFFSIPLIMITATLILFSSHFINVERAIIGLILLTGVLSGFSLSGMAIAFGVADITQNLKDSGKEPAGSESSLYLLISLLFIGLILLLDAVPVYFYFMKEAGKATPFERTWLVLGIAVGMNVLLNLGVTIGSLWKSINKHNKLQLL